MISSTSQDLGVYREQVKNACNGLGMFALMMEDLPAMNKDAVDVSLGMVDKADVYIGVFAHRYGYVPDGFEKSITHLEYERAIERDIPRLIFLIDEEVPVKKSNIDTGIHAELLDGLKKRLLKERVLKFFKDPPDLSYQVLLSLALFEKEYTQTLPGNQNLKIQKAKNEVSPLIDIPEPPQMDLPPSPYKGPNRFERDDAWVFFGRAKEIRELYKALVEKWCDPIILYCGESGVGKSSLLEAGVLPRLERTHNVLYIRRDGEIGLASTLALQLNSSPDNISKAWHAEETRTGKPLIVILDQVEEMYTSPVEAEGKAGYVEEEELVGILNRIFEEKKNRPRGRLVLAFRKEWSTDIESSLNKASLPWKKIFLERLSIQGVLEVIQGPQSSERLRKKYELVVEDGLPGLMSVEFLKDRQSSVGPALSIVLTKMWGRVKDTSRRVFDEDLFEEMKDEGIQLSDFIEDRLYQLERWNPEVARTGLYLDILHHYTTEQDTAESSRLQDVIGRYPGREKLTEAFIQWCLKYDLLAKTSEEGTRLVHDTLAPLIEQKYRTSTLPGQRAERILDNRIPGWLNGKTGATLDSFGLKEVERGAQGMRAWNEDEQRLVNASRRSRVIRRVRFGGVVGVIIIMASILFLLREQSISSRCVGAGAFNAWCYECLEAGGTYSATDADDALFCVGANGFNGLDSDDDFVLIRKGTFLMGSEYGRSDEIPVHQVTIEKGFWMSKTEVTPGTMVCRYGHQSEYIQRRESACGVGFLA